ncbi:MAG: YbbR-like domain-containing protein [Anaerovoracaceae bacterium]|jgi:YbbR domain-containing protein
MQDNKNKKPDSGRTISIILSIIIALLLWSYVIIQVNPTKEETISRVPVQLLNIQSLTARQLAIAGDGEYMVDVVVEGRRADIMKVSSEDIVAEADLFGWSKGENYIPVNVKVPAGLKLIEVRSAKIQVTIEDLVALSKPVSVVYRGAFPANTEEGDVELRPAEIEVTGAKSAVEDVDEVRVYIDVEDLSAEKRTVQSEVVPLNKAEMIVENVRLSSSYVNVSARLLQVKEVPLVVEMVGNLADGYGAEIDVPQSVLIKGTKAALQDIASVRAEPIDITGITNNAKIPLTLQLPEGVELSKKNPAITAGVTIEKTETKQFRFTADDILLDGLTKGKTVNTDVAEVIVSVTGRTQVVEQLQPDQLELYIDMEGLKTGSHTVPILVSSKVPLHNITVDPSEIHITILDTEQENSNE